MPSRRAPRPDEVRAALAAVADWVDARPDGPTPDDTVPAPPRPTPATARRTSRAARPARPPLARRARARRARPQRRGPGAAVRCGALRRRATAHPRDPAQR